jgi:tRNA1Val (adenine37-N6)-methyltransferase
VRARRSSLVRRSDDCVPHFAKLGWRLCSHFERPLVETTRGHLLGGRVCYEQPKSGFRTGIEPVLLAAAVPASAGDCIFEAGTGAGAALLCLAARVPHIVALGLERDSDLAALAQRNAAANGFTNLRFLCATLSCPTPCGPFDHACANPPWHAAKGTASPIPAREAAKRATPGLLSAWTRALVAPLRDRGTLTLVLPAALLPDALAVFADAGCPPVALFPLWPKPGRAAKLILIRGIKGGRSAFTIAPGLVLHHSQDGFTREAEAILRQGQALSW